MSGGIAPCVLNLALDGGEWSASDPGHFNTGERAPVPIGPQSRSGRDANKQPLYCRIGN